MLVLVLWFASSKQHKSRWSGCSNPTPATLTVSHCRGSFSGHPKGPPRVVPHRGGRVARGRPREADLGPPGPPQDLQNPEIPWATANVAGAGPMFKSFPPPELLLSSSSHTLRAPKMILIPGFSPGPRNRRFGRSKWPPPTAKPSGKGGGAKPCFNRVLKTY